LIPRPTDVQADASSAGDTVAAPLDRDAQPAGGAGERRIVRLSVAKLRPGPEVRFGGVDERHAVLLAASPGSLPPIVVNSATMAVVDGSHRVRAAQLRGEVQIAAVLVEGSEMEMYIAAVRANVEHGKPLTLEERQAAAVNLLRNAPQLSDRSIGDTCGLSHTTVGKIRRATGQNGQLQKRLGRDGRVRSARMDSPALPGAARSKAGTAASGDRTERSADAAATPRVGLADKQPRRSKGESHQSSAAGVRSLLADEAFRSTPALETFATWFDSKDVGTEEIALDLAQLPRNRIYGLSDRSRLRAKFWQDLATRLDVIAREHSGH
jgi:ParB-like chromosome segregation protein Spo0J